MTYNEITATKAEFALALYDAGLDVVSFVPERVTPPVVIIQSGSPYLRTSTVGREYEMTLDVILVAMTATNEMATETLDSLIEQFLTALPNYAVLNDIAAPYALDVNNAQYLAANATITVSLTI